LDPVLLLYPAFLPGTWFMPFHCWSIQELTVTLAYLPYDSDETTPSEGLRKLLTLVVGIHCSSSLGMMKMHTTIFGGA